MEAYKKSIDNLPQIIRSDIMEIQYSDLCDSRDDVMKKVLSFCDLTIDYSFQNKLSRYVLENQNYKWKQDLSDMQQRQLEEALNQLKWDRYYSDK